MLSSITSGLLVHDVCEELMSRLDAKDWNVQGITLVREPAIGLNNWKSYVSSVRGENFQIEFGQWLGEPFLRRLAVPCQEVNFWPASYSLTMNVYAYTDWERDRGWFLYGSLKYHGRKRGAIRYLRYESRCDCEKLNSAIFMRGTGNMPLPQ